MLNMLNLIDIFDDDVGGIFIDVEYVIFVIDNLGFMFFGSGWNCVIIIVNDILKNYFKMKGF